MSELADETDSKSVVLMDVWVRVPPSALLLHEESLFKRFFVLLEMDVLVTRGNLFHLIIF